MQRTDGGPPPGRTALVVGLALAVLLAPIVPATTVTVTSDGSRPSVALDGGTVAAATGTFPTAPWVNQSDTSHDPTTTTSLSVAYNATGKVGSAGDVQVELRNASNGNLVTANASLTATEGYASLSVPADTFSGDQSVTYRLRNATSGASLATDTSMLLSSGGGSSTTITIDSVSLPSQTVAPGSNFDVDVTLSNTGSSSGSTTLKAFNVGTTESISELANRSVSVGAGSTKTVTVSASLDDAGLADIYVVAGQGFKRTQVLVQPSNSVSVTGYTPSTTTVEQNEDLDVTVTVSNAGSSDDWILVPLYHDGDVVQMTNVSVPAGGQKQVTVTTTFSKQGSHTLAVGGQSATSVTVQRRGSPSVVDSSVRVVGGTQPSGDVVAGTTVSNGELDIRLKAAGVQNGEADLANVGADATTRFEVEIELANFTPRMMMGTGGNVSWSLGSGSTADTSNLTITLEPREAQRYYRNDGSEPTYSTWPKTNKQATTMREAQAQFTLYSMGKVPVRFRTMLTGGTIVTDAQSFSPPRYKQGSNTRKPRLTVQVAAPHTSVDGDRNQGHYEALIPDGMLERWGVTSAGNLRAAYGGSQTQSTFTETSDGIKMKLDTHYSAESVEIKPGGADTTAPTADAGSDFTATTGQTVTLDASATTDNVGLASYEWDVDDDGTYEKSTTSETVSHAFGSAGTRTVTLRATDGAGNTDVDAVIVTVNSAAGGGGGGGAAGANTARSVSVSADAGGAAVDVVGGTTDDPVDVGFGPTPPAAGGVTVEGMSVAADGDFGLSVAAATDPSSLPASSVPSVPGASAGTAPLGYVSVEHPSLDDADVAGATFTLSVEAATLADRGVAPEEVVVYRLRNGAWSALDTRLESSADGVHRFAVDSPGLSVFAVGVATPSFAVDASTTRTDLTVGESTTVRATVENVGTATGTHTAELVVDGEATATRTVSLDPGQSTTVTFSVTPDATGTYAVAVDDASAGRVDVTEASDATSSPTPRPTTADRATATASTGTRSGSDSSAPGFGPVAALLAVLATGLLAGRYRR